MEKSQNYYNTYSKCNLGAISNDEKWADVTKSRWSYYVSDTLMGKAKEIGVDSFYLDHADIYYNIHTNKVYNGILKICKNAQRYNVPIILNDADTFVEKAIIKKHNRFFNIVVVHNAFSDKNNDIEYFKEYMLKCKKAGLNVILQEDNINKEITDFCSKNKIILTKEGVNFEYSTADNSKDSQGSQETVKPKDEQKPKDDPDANKDINKDTDKNKEENKGANEKEKKADEKSDTSKTSDKASDKDKKDTSDKNKKDSEKNSDTNKNVPQEDSKKQFANEFGVFIGAEKPKDLSVFAKYHTVVVDHSNYTKADIDKMHKQGNKVYSYLNVGSLENWRDYYSKWSKYKLGTYENWSDEVWMDVSKIDWQNFLINDLGKQINNKGFDGYFLDNMDIYWIVKYDSKMKQSNSKIESVYQGLNNIVNGLHKYNKDIVVNGGDEYVNRLMNENKSNMITAVNQESTFTTVKNYSKDIFGRQKESDEKYFTDYLDRCKQNDIQPYVLEYTKDANTKTYIKDFCNKHGYYCFISDTVKLNKVK